MSLKTLAESYRYSLAPVNLPEADPRSCRGVFHSNGLAAFDMLLAEAVAGRPNALDVNTLEMAIRAFFAEIGYELSQNHTVVLESLGITLSLEVGGSLPSLDADPGEDNPLYVNIRLDGEKWDVLKGVVPERIAASADTPRLYAVEDAESHEQSVVDGVKQFIVTGGNLSVSAPDEQLQLADSAKTIHVATVDSCQMGQRLTAHFVTAPAAGKAKMTLSTHGSLTPEGILYNLPKNVTVLEAEGPTPTGDEPVVTSGHSSGYGDAGMIDPNADFIMEGSHLGSASVKVDWTDGGGNERTLTVPAGETSAEDESITLQQGDWLDACTTVDGAVLTFMVTTSHGSTTYQATVRA